MKCETSPGLFPAIGYLSIKKYYLLTGLMSVRRQDSKNEISSVPGDLNPRGRQVHGKAETVFVCVMTV